MGVGGLRKERQMSKSSKIKNAEERRKIKFARKRAKREEYLKYAKEGKSKSSKRFVSKKRRFAKNISHKDGKCGNPACVKCSGINFHNFIKKNGVVKNMPNWMWLRYDENIWQKT
jgi:hypothetical protein